MDRTEIVKKLRKIADVVGNVNNRATPLMELAEDFFSAINSYIASAKTENEMAQAIKKAIEE